MQPAKLGHGRVLQLYEEHRGDCDNCVHVHVTVQVCGTGRMLVFLRTPVSIVRERQDRRKEGRSS